MQQLNVLPINVAQNVDLKDDAAALASPSSKDDFSQHIDLHLAKNKGSSDVNNSAAPEHVNRKIDKIAIEQNKPDIHQKNQETSDNSTKSSKSGKSQTMVDETEPAKNKPEVATSGKITEKESNQAFDESALLMSFLTKADKTLIEDNSASEIKQGEISAEQKAKYEAQLLLKSSGLVADLSGVAKAITSDPAIEGDDLLAPKDQVKPRLASSKATKENTEINPFNSTAVIEDDSMAGKVSVSEKVDKLNKHSSASLQINLAQLDKHDASDSVTKKTKAIALAQDKSAQPLVDLELKAKTSSQIESGELDIKAKASSQIERGELEIKAKASSQIEPGELDIKAKASSQIEPGELDIKAQASSQIGVDSEKIAQKELSQQGQGVIPISKNQHASDIKVSAKSSASVQTITKAQNALEVESSINEKIATIMQNEKGMANPDTNLTAANSIAQHANRHKNVSAVNLGQTIAESKSEQASLAESDTQLGAKSVEHLIEQSKAMGVIENKDVSAKATMRTNTDFTVNDSLMDATSRSTQTAYDRAAQQVAEIVNPTGSSEVSQSQKTNTQLHQETISIFRRDFADAVKDKVMLMISQKLQQFDITLDPPELGNMQVRVNLQGEQATVNFVVQNQQAKESLEQNMQKLKDSLAEQGVDVGDANVEQQSQQSGDEESAQDNDNHLMTNTADASDVIEHSLSASLLEPSTRAVDYYA